MAGKKSDLAELSMGELVDELKATKQEAAEPAVPDRHRPAREHRRIEQGRTQVARIKHDMRARDAALGRT